MAGRGRPKGSKSKKNTTVAKKVCTNCNRELLLSSFYVASNPFTSSDGKRVNVCKDCIKICSTNPDGTINADAFKNMLMLIDRPFVPRILDIAIKESEKTCKDNAVRTDVIGLYMKNISSLIPYSKMTFADGENYKEDKPTNSNSVRYSVVERTNRGKEEAVFVNENIDFDLTEDIVDRFGEGYTKSQYAKMQKKYDKLKQNYQLTTNLHEEALATYVRFKVREEEATANGDVESANKWNKAAQDAAEKAKLTPKQLTQADLQGGITTISEISKAVEEAADIIEILPRFKYAPNDAPDFIIWCYINFCRKLKGLPEVDYEEVYKFYDRKKEEYIAQYGDPYGIFTDDTSEKNREAVKKFIQLPKDYNVGSDTDGE